MCPDFFLLTTFFKVHGRVQVRDPWWSGNGLPGARLWRSRCGLGGAVRAPRPQRGAVRPEGTRWPPLQARDRSGAHPGGLERQKEVELARCDHTTSSCKLFCELCCTHPPTARARAYCGFYVLPATTALHSCAQAQQTCQHGKILPVAHGSASWAGRSGKRPQCLACSSQWGWSGGRRDNSKALQFCQYM